MCIHFCKKYKGKIEDLQKENRDLQTEVDACYEACEGKDRAIERLKKELSEHKEEEPSPVNEAVKSLHIHNGVFHINGTATKLIGVSKREMLAVGAGFLEALRMDYSIKPVQALSSVNYDYPKLKQAILNSQSNYVRVIIPKNLPFARKEIKDFLAHGIVVEVELFDAGNPDRTYQAHWEDAFHALQDLPVFFDAHNEFCDKDYVGEVVAIINYVTGYGKLIGAGAWGSSIHGREYSDKLKQATNKYHIVTHHRKWTEASLLADKEIDKPLIMNEIHTRDHNLTQIKALMKMGYENCEGVQVYSLQNFGSGENSNFQKILDYVVR